MILQLLNKLSGKNEPQKLFPKTSFVRRIYNLIDSGWDFGGIFSVYTVWADIATGSVISLWDPDYCYGLWADETTFAYVWTASFELMHAFSCDSETVCLFQPCLMQSCYVYTAKLLFHQSPTRHSDYTVTTIVTM